jgi:hypothetical protein
MTLHPETVLAQSEMNSVLRAGTLDRPHLSRFARTVKSLDDLEPTIGAVLAEHVEPGESIRQIIAAPRQAVLSSRHTAKGWFGMPLPWELTPDWVLVLMEERVLAAAVDQPGAMPVVTSTRIADILSLEMGAILLHAWLEWTFSSQGRTVRTRIYYNAVCQRLFQKALDTMRQGPGAPQTTRGDRHLEYLYDLPFKFMNIIMRNLLLPGEQVQAVVYQPAIWTTRFRLFRRQQTAAMALVLTDSHILVAQEELTGRADHWGLITRFFPRCHIQHATMEQEAAYIWLRLALERRGATQKESLPFEPGAEAALGKLLALLHSQ